MSWRSIGLVLGLCWQNGGIWGAVAALAEEQGCWAAGLRSEVAVADQNYSLALKESEHALATEHDGQRQVFCLLWRATASA